MLRSAKMPLTYYAAIDLDDGLRHVIPAAYSSSAYTISPRTPTRLMESLLQAQ